MKEKEKITGEEWVKDEDATSIAADAGEDSLYGTTWIWTDESTGKVATGRVVDTGTIGPATMKPDDWPYKYTYTGATEGAVEDTEAEGWVKAERPEEKKEPPLYAEDIMPHIIRAKEEGVRRGIEGDTIVIDRGVAISQGVDHADMILGLKVKYAKEGALPMDSAFIIFKDKEKDKEKERAAAEKKTPAAAEKKDPPRFIKYTGDDGPCLLAIDRIITAKHIYLEDLGTKVRHWNYLEVLYDAGPGTDVLQVFNRRIADSIWKILCLTTDEDPVGVIDSIRIPAVLDTVDPEIDGAVEAYRKELERKKMFVSILKGELDGRKEEGDGTSEE